MKPRLLDLFCGAGGAARGYQLAGFHVTGVDNRPQPRYAGDAFILGDALEFCAAHGAEFDAIHASPPCQAYSVLAVTRPDRRWPDLIAPTRELLQTSGVPYVIENVPGSPLLAPALVCGLVMGLGTKRHRLFESSLLLFGTGCRRGHPGDWITVAGDRSGRCKRPNAKSPKRLAVSVGAARQAMGIGWMTGRELSQAIPPAYTEFVGRQLRAALAIPRRKTG